MRKEINGPHDQLPELVYTAVENRCVVCKGVIDEDPSLGDLEHRSAEYRRMAIAVCSEECQALLPLFPSDVH